MKAKELREKSDSDLNATLSEKLRSQFKLRLNKGNTELFKPHELKDLRRDIARIMTILAERKEGLSDEQR